MALPPWGRGGHLLLTARINIKRKIYARILKTITYLLEKQAETAQSAVSWVFHSRGVANSGSIMLTLATNNARHARDYIAPSLLSRRRKATACQQRSLDRERSVTRGSGLVSGCILQEIAIRGDRKIFETSRCTHHNAPLIHEIYRLHRAVPAEATPSLAATTAVSYTHLTLPTKA